MLKSIEQGDAETRAELSPDLLQLVYLEEWVKILEKPLPDPKSYVTSQLCLESKHCSVVLDIKPASRLRV